jgi:signal transduction histidine kinase
MNASDFGAGLQLPDEARQTADLLSQIAWFNRLRLIVAGTVIALTALAAHVLGIVADPLRLYALGGLIAVVDLIYMAWFPRLSRQPAHRVRRHVFVQISIDLLILTALLHFTGGVTNPLVLFYLFHTFIAALVLSVRAACFAASISLALVTLLGAAERCGWLPHLPLADLGLLDLQKVRPLGFVLLLLGYALTMAFSIYFLGSILQRLRANEQQLLRLSRSLAMSEKLASVGTLAAGVSHEINNPVGVINNKVQILRYRIQDGDERGKLLHELDVIEKHTRRIGQITAGLLTFSRETPFEKRPLDIGALLQEAADLVRVPFRTAGVQLQIESGEACRLAGSQNHLLQVLINILLNAKDASPQGGAVRLGWVAGPTEVAIVIADRGTGISEENLRKVFDPFFTTKDVDKGTGLGLAISHGIVERHGGRIEVDSKVGEGSVFRVVLPLDLAPGSAMGRG